MGNKGSQLLLPLWKNYFSQKRKAGLTMFEIGIPTIFALILTLIRLRVSRSWMENTEWPQSSEWNHLSLNSTLPRKLVNTPRNDRVDMIMRNVAQIFGLGGFCEPDREKCDSGMTHPQCPNPKASGASRQRPRARQAPPGSQDHPQTDWRKQIMGERVPHGPARSIFSRSNMPVREQEIFGRSQQTSSLPQRPDAGFVWGSSQQTVRSAPRFQSQPDVRFDSQSQGGQILPSRQTFGEFGGGTIGRVGDSSSFPQSSDFGSFSSSLGHPFVPAGSNRMGSQGPSPRSTMDRPVQDRLPRAHMDFSGSMGSDMGMTGIGGSRQGGIFPEFMSGSPDSGMRPYQMF